MVKLCPPEGQHVVYFLVIEGVLLYVKKLYLNTMSCLEHVCVTSLKQT